MTTNLKKRDGRLESFNKEKLERSIIDAGGSAETSRRISESLVIRDGMSSNDLRRMVTNQLRQTDIRTADIYDRQRRINIKKMEDIKIGTIHVDRTIMTDLHLTPGDPLEIVLDNRTERMITEISNGTGLSAYLNDYDLKSLKLSEGNRVLVRTSQRD